MAEAVSKAPPPCMSTCKASFLAVAAASDSAVRPTKSFTGVAVTFDTIIKLPIRRTPARRGFDVRGDLHCYAV